jgi:prepilin-type N-terminal cleavage/methylation domain-containing protein
MRPHLHPPQPSDRFGITLRLLQWLASRRSNTDAGLTLIECLVAIIIIALLVVAVTPPVFLASATRIQSRKAERANQVAQGEIDRVRLLVERGGYSTTVLPSDAGTQDATTVTAASSVSGLLISPASCNTYPGSTPVASTQLILVDVNGDCSPEYVMQVFRTSGQVPSGSSAGTAPTSFTMGVRVYAYTPGETLPSLGTTQIASLVIGSGARDNVTTASGSRERRPLAMLYSTLIRNDSSQSLCTIRKDLSKNANACTY